MRRTLTVAIILACCPFLMAENPEGMTAKDYLSRLASPDYSAREEATLKLSSMGEEIRSDIYRAARSRHPETRARAFQIIEALDEAAEMRRLGSEQRSEQLRVVTLPSRSRGIPELLQRCSAQTGLNFRVENAPKGQVSRINGSDLPLRAVLDDAGLVLTSIDEDGTWNLEPGQSGYHHVAGASFRVTRAPWFEEGRMVGTVLNTEILADTNGVVDFTFHAIHGDKEITWAICPHHSPERVLIRGADPGDLKVDIEGTVYWHSDLKLQFNNPARDQYHEIGPYKVYADNRRVRVEYDGMLPGHVMLDVLRSNDVDVETRPGARQIKPRRAIFVRRHDDSKRDWCGCNQRQRNRPALGNGLQNTITHRLPCMADDVRAVQVTIHPVFSQTFSLSDIPVVDAE